MAELSLQDRIKGSLIGAAIGAELGLARCVRPERFTCEDPAALHEVTLEPALDWEPEPHRRQVAGASALVDAGVRAYLTAGGRAMPEHFGRVFQDHDGIAAPAFWWDQLHSTQEVLKEGMHPRISGIGAGLNGLICAAMPAVGIYHFADSDSAYLDGIELASVAQGRLGADWAGLCAAAVAAAFQAQTNGSAVVDSVMDLAFENNKDLFYELDWALKQAGQQTEEEFLRFWVPGGGVPRRTKDTVWIAYNPLAYILPVVQRYLTQPRKLMTALIVPPALRFAHSVIGPIGGAMAGAAHGPAAFPKQWLEWAEAQARTWFELGELVERRVRSEARIIALTERLRDTPEGETTLLRDKILGCILAGAIGNAMGSPVEGRLYTEIDEAHPGGVTGILDPARLESEDDNQMAMLLVETYLRRRGRPVTARHFGRTWQDRLNRDHFFPYCMGHAYELIRQGWDSRITGHWIQVTGSTVMCMEPVGIFHLADPEFAAIDATAVSYMYQRGLDVTAAAMLAATVAEAFRPEADVDSVCRAALDVAPTEPLRTFDERPFGSCHEYLLACLEVASKYDDVMAVRAELYEKCLCYHHIDPLELWGLTLAMLKVADGDVRQTAIGGTNIGRDSDTIAGRGAMLAGILRGAGNVPPEWIDLFPPEALERIYRNADRLARLVAEQKLTRLMRRQWVANIN